VLQWRHNEINVAREGQAAGELYARRDWVLVEGPQANYQPGRGLGIAV